jgi:hypothetical protein
MLITLKYWIGTSIKNTPQRGVFRTNKVNMFIKKFS